MYSKANILGVNYQPVGSGKEVRPATFIVAYQYRRPLFDGYVTVTEDGNPVVSLLGRIQGYDGGAVEIQMTPFSDEFFERYLARPVE